MRKLIIILSFLLLFSVSSEAEIKQLPDQILFSTSIGTLHTVDSFLVSPSQGGVSLYVYNDSLEKYRFVSKDFYPEINPVTTKVSDSILIIESQDEKLYFFSLANLPEIEYLSFVDLNRPFADYTLIGNSLYIAGFYDGILRYNLTNYSQVDFVDSSMTGILVSQISHDEQYLYALDEYNGLLKYELTQNGFGLFVDYLFVPLRAFAYTKVDSLFYLHLITGGLMVGDFNQPLGDNIIDSISTIYQVQDLYFTDSLLIIASNRELSTIKRSDYTDTASYQISDLVPKGLINLNSELTSLMLPSRLGGLSFVTIDTTAIVSDGLEFNGAINNILIHNSNLYMSNHSEPVYLFKIDSTGFTYFNYPLYDNLSNSGHIANNGDSLFVVYPDIEKLAIITNTDDPNAYLWENSISISPLIVKDIHYNNQQLFDNALVFVQYPYKFEIFAVSDSGYLNYEGEWKFSSDMTSFATKDSIAVVTNRKKECEIYRVDEFYEKHFLTSYSLSATATESVFHNELLYIFHGEEMSILNFSDIENIYVDTTVALLMDVEDAVIVENQMFTVGTQGITRFDLSDIIPGVMETGGLPGNSIAVDSNIIAIHDNQTVMLYYHDLPLSEPNTVSPQNDVAILGQNYPNPFNLVTVIRYSLPYKTDVQIAVYNILGQRIKTLVQKEQDAGNYTVSWDGTNSSGNVIASGIYFYKLETENIVNSKKMILIK